MVVEELGVDLLVIDMVLGDIECCFWDMGIFGLLIICMFGLVLCVVVV